MDLTDVPWDPGKSEDVTPPPSPPRVGSALCPGSSLVDVEMDFPSVGPSRETRDPIPPSPMLPSDSEEGRPAPVQSEGPSPIARPSLIGQGQPDVVQSECSEPQSPANECDPEPVPPIGEMPAHPSPGDRAAGRSLSIGQGSPGPSPSDQTGWTEHPVDLERTHSPCDRDLPVEPARSVAPEVDDSSTEVDEGSEERAHPAGRGCPGYSTPETPHAIGQELTETSLDADPSERAPPIGQEPAESAAEVLPDARGADRTPGGQRGGRSHPAGGDLARPRSGEQPDETIGLEFSQRSSAEQESERAHPPGQKPAESLSDDQRVGGAPAAGEEAIGQEPAAGEDTERSRPSGGGSDGTASAEDGGERGLAEPAPVGRHTERRRPIGEELAGLSLADRHVERTQSIGQEATEPLLGDHGAGGDLVGFPPDDQHIGRNNSIGQELTESSLDGKATGESGSAPLASGDRRDETAGSIGQEATLRPERSHPIGEELSHHPAERGPPIGQDLADSALDGHHVEGARSIGQQLSEPSPDDEDIESCRATGGELAGLPLDGGNFGGTPSIGQDLADSTLDGHHVEGAHSIGQQLYEPSPDDEDIESCRATGGELAGSPLDGGNFGGTPPIGQDLADSTLDGHHVEGARSIGQELTEPSWDQEDTERTRVIGEELHESSPAGDHIEMDYYVCQELTASTPGGQCTEQTCPIGEEIAGLPPLGGHHSPRTLSIGQEDTESVLDDLHSEKTHPIGQQLIELPLEDHQSERACHIGQQLIELPLEDHQSERAHSIGQQQVELQMEDHHSERTLPIGQQLIELQMEDHQSERAHPIGQQLIELPLEDHQSERAHSIGQQQIELQMEDHHSERTLPIGQQLIELQMEDHQGERAHPIGQQLIELPLEDHQSERAHSIGQQQIELQMEDHHSERTLPIGQQLIELQMEDHQSERAHPIGQQLIELPLEDHQSERAHSIGQQQIELPVEDHQSERARPIDQNLTEAPLDEGTRAEGEGLHESGSGLIPLAPGDRHKETVQCIGQELLAPAPGHVEREPPVGREDVGDHLADDGGLVVYPPGDGQAERRDGVSGGPRGPYEGGGEEVVDGPRGKVQVYFLVGCPEEAEEEGFRKRASTLPTGEAGSQRRGRATLRRQEALAAQGEAEGHPPLAKCSSCPTPEERTGGETGPAEKRPDGRSGSRDWHRRGIRRPSMATFVTQGGEEESAEERAEGSVRTETRDAGGSRPGEVNLRRKESRILHICQPLYQEYIHQALDREIRRQRPSDACPSPEGLRGRRGPSLLQRASLGIPTGLWRDLPEVRNSIDFESVGPEESKLQEVKFELISSEASYLRSLDIAVNHFQGSETLNALLVPQERQWLFSKLPAVRTVSQRFLAELEENFEENVLSFDVCGTLLSHLPEFRVVYIPYLTNQSYQEKTFKNLIKKNPQFLRVVESLEAHPICQRLTLKSFLILPFQRIARLRLLVQNILQRSVRGSEDEEKALRAAEGLGELMRDSNENVCRLRHTEELIALSRVLDFESKIFPLVSQSRRLVKHGSLTEIEQTPTALTWRKGTTRPIYLHLFNDCILLSRQRENGRFTVFDHSTTQNLVVQSLRVKPSGEARFLFQLSLQENHRGRYQEFLLRASSQSQKLRWISALRPMKQDIDLTKHYKSKQVQCLKPYKPREFDEMPLQKADIIIVTQESSDGWEEGYRLSDGDRGWFPSSHVEVITSYRSRVRNIEERLHLSHKSSRSSGLP